MNSKLKIRILTCTKNPNSEVDEYFVSGHSIFNDKVKNFEGKIIIKHAKKGIRRTSLYGDYDLIEEGEDGRSGKLTGLLSYTFDWNHNINQKDKHFVKFEGKWRSFDQSSNYITIWKNY